MRDEDNNPNSQAEPHRVLQVVPVLVRCTSSIEYRQIYVPQGIGAVDTAPGDISSDDYYHQFDTLTRRR
ncbi:hypothetical protein ACK8P5_25895 (plasmid) [Paenibacillus sp. EC2-1]|uniref:hypothetical protein n=1 Tax=Paenibacillus sp. EC2-1 TaxID=3388665 RepID=UPI003BEF0D33